MKRKMIPTKEKMKAYEKNESIWGVEALVFTFRP
jgi:hypothetical protein